ncbi:MAG: hypothetical protein KGZ74_02655 [Chitinophagaceae bacterium]|nr:hypothetical protein [Chitinophagaceae bacterium]
MYKFLLLFLAASITSSAQKIDQMKWVVGTWKINAGANIIIEEWNISNDSTIAGKSYFIKNGTDTIPQETVEIAFRNGDWYYIPTVKNQNNAQPVPFKVIFLRGMEFISENTAHDFPQRIAYRRIKNQIFASIEGRRNGKYSKQNFDFTSE